MTHNWFSAKNSNKNSRDRNASGRDNKEFGDFEKLEEKRCLAFLGFFDGVTLDLDQTADDGDIVVENGTGVWRATDNAGTFTFVNATNLTVNLLDNTGNDIEIFVESEHTGDVVVNAGAGSRNVSFPGDFGGGMADPLFTNVIGGDLEVNGDAGSQLVNLIPVAGWPMTVRGSASFNLGVDDDTVIAFDPIAMAPSMVAIETDLALSGVNVFPYWLTVGLPGPPPTDGNVTVDTTVEDAEASMTTIGASIFYGDFTYTGGVNLDHIELGSMLGGVEIFGDSNIDLGVGNSASPLPQNVSTMATFRGDLNIVAGDSIPGNEMTLVGTFMGNIVSYAGGDLVDTITYSLIGPQADVFVTFGAGDDTFTITTPVNQLEIDFGNDAGDLFDNQIGAFNFEFDITNYQWFDHFYTATDDTLVMNQLIDTGDIIIDNDGGLTGFDWQMFSGIGGMTATVRSENFVLNMLSNTNNNVEIDLFNPVIASIALNVGDGDRLIEFTGIANNPLRDIVINAGAGDQHVDLSLNHPLGVATLDIDLGSGFDTVDDNANDLKIDEDLVFSGVNLFENDGVLFVTRNLIINTAGESQDNIFANNGTMFVGGFATYTGGDSRDEVRLNGPGGTEFVGDVSINLGDNLFGGTQRALFDQADVVIGGNLTVSSTGSATPDEFRGHPGAEFNKNVDIDLGGGLNTADIIGVLGGSTVNYTGGSATDIVTYGMTGNPAILTVDLGGGDDTFNLLAGSSITSPLNIDFSGGVDTFNNSYGNWDFDANLSNLNGFNHVYNLAANTLTSTQVSGSADIVIDNNGVGGSLQFNNGGIAALTNANHFTLNMQSGSGTNVDLQLDNAFPGDVTIGLGNGDRGLNFTGTDNSIGGALVVNGGTGDQTVELAVNNGLTVAGKTTINLDAGNDTVDEDGNSINIGGGLDLLNVNTFENNGAMNVTGNVYVDVSLESRPSVFSDGSPMVITGDFTYIGSDSDDQVIFDATSSVGGDIWIDAKNGTNTAVLVNVFGGSTVNYLGGSGTDDVSFGMTGVAPQLNVELDGGDDTFTLMPGAGVTGTLTIDFGSGSNTFVNNFGAFAFDADLKGLGGFNHFYDFSAATLTSNQILDMGAVVVDNDGVADAIQFSSGGTSILTPVDNLTIHLLDSSTGSLDVNLNNALAGNLSLYVGDADRAVTLGGTDNSIGGDLLIDGGDGAQMVEAAVNNGLTVTGNASIHLGGGSDTLGESGNGMDIGGDLAMTGVNVFTNNGVVSVGGHLTFDNSGEAENSFFNDDGTLTVSGNFDYVGNSGRDIVTLNSASPTTFGGYVNIQLGDNLAAGTQTVLITAPASIAGALDVTSTDDFNTDSFKSTAAVTIGGNIHVDLAGGTNDAEIQGVFGGATVDYIGGNGVDDVMVGTTGNAAAVSATLGADNDTFTLLAGSSVSSLFIDFGAGNDSFVNGYGPFDFPATLLGLDGFSHTYDPVAATLASVQVSGSGGPVTFDNNGPGGAMQVTSATTTTLGIVDHLDITMLDNGMDSLLFDFDSPLAGDLNVVLGDGDRDVNFIGTDNSIGGTFDITGGTGDQEINAAFNNGLSIGGNAVIDLGTGRDSFNANANSVTVGGNLDFLHVNQMNIDGALQVAGNLNVDSSAETENTSFIDSAMLDVAGDFTFSGNDADDTVSLKPNASVGGNIDIHLANGTNTAVLDGAFGGSTVKYNGGSGADNVTYGLSGTPTNPNIKLSSGDDNFVLQSDAAISAGGLRVDFGGGVDSFTNDFGAFTFDAKLLNWAGFDRFYFAATDTLNMVQDLDLGDVTLDNNGAGAALRLTTGALPATEMTPATDARIILLDNSSQNVTVDFDSVHNGDMIVQVRNGDRDIFFTGTSNTFGGLLRVEASDGIQNVHLAVNADLNALGSLVVNGRDGSDTIDDGANDINVGNAMILRGVNNFNNDNRLTVGGDFNMITSLETEATRFGNSGSISIGGNITYLSGNGVDRIVFNGGTVSVGGYTYLDLAAGNDLAKAQRVILRGGFSTASLTAIGSSSLGGYEVVTDAATNIAGNVIVNFTGSNAANTVSFFGTYGGTYGTFRSGNAADTIVFGAVGTNMDFVVRMGNGGDMGTLEATTSLKSLFLDFGGGVDFFVDNLGLPASFPVTVANL